MERKFNVHYYEIKYTLEHLPMHNHKKTYKVVKLTKFPRLGST